MEPHAWQMWVDFARGYSGLTYGHVDDTAPGIEIAAGRYLIVGDHDADPAVAQIVEIKDDGTVLLRVYPAMPSSMPRSSVRSPRDLAAVNGKTGPAADGAAIPVPPGAATG